MMSNGHIREAAMYRRTPVVPATTVRRKTKTGRVRRIFTR
jgi:hypothetical protein